AFQHVLASFVGIITPPLIIGSTLGLTQYMPYLISMALMVSGTGTFIQARRPFGIGAGMICLQGTSFAFLGAVLSAGFLVKQRGGSPEDIMAMIFGVCFFGALVQIALSRCISQLRRVITPLVTGIVITLIGVSLIKVGVTDLGGGFNAPDFGAPVNLALGAFVLAVIIVLNRSTTPWVRLSAIIIGLAVGSLAAWFSGKLVPQPLHDLPLISVPMPFRFGFNFDWSLFHENGQAVKANYAGHHWSDEAFAQRFQQAREQLEFLGRPLHALKPGQYRAYLAPAALDEVIGMLTWGGFSAQSLASKRSPLQRLYDGETLFSPLVNFDEQVSGSLSPAFSREGYPRKDLKLIVDGQARDRLVDSSSAAEYDLPANGADDGEGPSALSIAGGSLELDQILARLGTGLYISNLWYLNFSDRAAARLTGMTRFATFWVEEGKIVAPVSTMRFDDSAYSLLGGALEDLTKERELILQSSTYSQRQTGSIQLPGALISRLTLTL
ncbi:solute carrier family 23 protein, partial [Pseudomonas syringae]|uniref:solute carrier family 23 protein n=1 Tax=Pseudomonas syringae TaxID=317 RepID=UPI00218020B0